jgi:hypothetical protein
LKFFILINLLTVPPHTNCYVMPVKTKIILTTLAASLSFSCSFASDDGLANTVPEEVLILEQLDHLLGEYTALSEIAFRVDPGNALLAISTTAKRAFDETPFDLRDRAKMTQMLYIYANLGDFNTSLFENLLQDEGLRGDVLGVVQLGQLSADDLLALLDSDSPAAALQAYLTLSPDLRNTLLTYDDTEIRVKVLSNPFAERILGSA